MEKPSIPKDEITSLRDLRSLNILDTPPEERFDRLTRMAKRIFNVPIALVSLIDENRQWFKSCDGLSVQETSRDISFCGHAEGDNVLSVFANLMMENLRDSDIFARLGGDEFVVFFINTAKKGAENVVSKIKNLLNDYNKKMNLGYEISFSHGIAEFDPKKNDSIDELLVSADALMYECKKKSKN